MRRVSLLCFVVLFASLISVNFAAQKDPLQGRWEGKVQAMQGERAAVVIFKKEGEKYIGTVSGGVPMPVQIKDVQMDGDNLTAKSEIQTPQATIPINYTFTLQGDKLTGKGELMFGTQPVTFTFELQRVSEDPAAQPSAQFQRNSQRGDRPLAEQPLQKQTIDYFVGQWSFKWTGRESAFWPGGQRTGTVTFVKKDQQTLESKTVAQSDQGAYQESATIRYDDATKTFTFSESLSNRLRLESTADWKSPLSIRFTYQPVKHNGQTLMLKRTIAVVSEHSFTVTEELSEDGSRFVRLGNAIFSKVANPAK